MGGAKLITILKTQFSYKTIKTFASALYVYKEIIARHLYVCLLGSHFHYLGIFILSSMAILLQSSNYDSKRFIRQSNGDSCNNVNQSPKIAHLDMSTLFVFCHFMQHELQLTIMLLHVTTMGYLSVVIFLPHTYPSGYLQPMLHCWAVCILSYCLDFW